MRQKKEHQRLKILLIEDNSDHAELIREMLNEVNYIVFDLECADRLSTGLERIVEGRFDAVLLDLSLPDSQGFDTFARVHSRVPEATVVVLSALDDEMVAIEAVHAGAQDYLVKGEVSSALLRRSLCYAVERNRMRKNIDRLRRDWENIFQATGNPTIILDPEHGIIAANRATEEAVGKSQEELLGKKCYEIFHGLSQPSQRCPMEHGLSTYRYEKREIALETLEGTYLVNCTPILDEAGHLDRIIHTATNITGRKRSEEELLLFRNLIDNSNDAIFVAHPETLHFLDVNRKACTNLGYTRQEMLSMGILDVEVGPPEDFQWDKFIRKIRDKGDHITEGVQKRKDGTTFPVEVSIKYLHHETHDYLVTVARDITERKRMEEELTRHRQHLEELVEKRTIELTETNELLRQKITEHERADNALKESEERYRTVVDNINFGVTLMDADYNVIMTNSTVAKLFKKDIGKMVGKKCYAEFAKRESICENCPGTLAMDTRLPQSIEAIGVRDDGTRVSAWNRAFPTFGADGEVTGFIEIGEDINERVELKQRLMRTEKLASLAELAATIAHEIGNPLGAITNSIGVLKNKLELAGKQKELMRIVELETQRINRIIKDYLMFARLKKTDLIEWPITLLMQETLILFQEDKKYHPEIQILQQYDKNIPRIWLDPNQIRQVFWNLLINAIEAMPGKGTLKVSIKQHKYKTSTGVGVKITDTGVGIKPKARDKIFDLFYTDKPDGSGLGLAIVQQIVDTHGGVITLESQENAGTEVFLFLPANRPVSRKIG